MLTTNKAFSDWTQVFAAASLCQRTDRSIDRIVRRAEIVKIDGGSYRQKEAMEPWHHGTS